MSFFEKLKNMRNDRQQHRTFLDEIQKEKITLNDVPPIHRDYKMCSEAVRKNGLALKDVPRMLKNMELGLEAVHQNPEAIEFIPDNILKMLEKDAFLQLRIAINNHPQHQKYLDEIQEGKITLSKVPTVYRDYQMCLEAVKKDGLALKDIPKSFPGSLKESVLMERALCLEAIRQNPEASQFVPRGILKMLEEQGMRIAPSGDIENISPSASM
jgi:hypothetical protein